MEPIFFDFIASNESKRVCLLDWPSYQTAEQLGDSLAARFADSVEQTELVILRPDVDIPISDWNRYNDGLDRLVRRVPRAGIYILHSFNFEHRLSLIRANPNQEDLSIPECDDLIMLTRECELECYARKSDALLSARNGFVYKAPSGQFVRQFLRVGNIQKSRQAINAVFFWMLPYMKHCCAIIVDTWSISSIALNSARLLERYQKGIRCRVDMFSTYFDGSDNSYSIADNILQHTCLEENSSVLVIFSAVRSGRSLSQSQSHFEEVKPHQQFRYLAIYTLDNTSQVDALCSRLSSPAFDSVDGNDAVITIDASSYFPVTVKDKPLNIRKSNASPNKDFFDSFKGARVLRIHRDVHDLSGNKLQHHAFDIDVESLLEKTEFLDLFHTKLNTLNEISIVVVPPHNAGKKMGNEACKYLEVKNGVTPKLIIHADLDPRDICQEVKDVFRDTYSQTNILILDDVSTTGQRLSDYQTSLRKLEFCGHISYLVGVARPDDDSVWDNRIRNLKFRGSNHPNHTVEYVEKIVLPNWDEKRCPWCMESSWLSREIRKTDGFNPVSRNLAINRHRTLLKAADGEGLINEVFWIPPTQLRPTITRGSIFVHHDGAAEADIVASVAGAIQRMRVNEKEEQCLRYDFPQPRILAPENYLGPAPSFNDHILKMSILRSALASELRRWNDQEERQRTKQIQDSFIKDQDSMALEYIVAMTQRKISLTENSQINGEENLAPEVRGILETVLQRES